MLRPRGAPRPRPVAGVFRCGELPRVRAGEGARSASGLYWSPAFKIARGAARIAIGTFSHPVVVAWILEPFEMNLKPASLYRFPLVDCSHGWPERLQSGWLSIVHVPVIWSFRPHLSQMDERVVILLKLRWLLLLRSRCWWPRWGLWLLSERLESLLRDRSRRSLRPGRSSLCGERERSSLR